MVSTPSSLRNPRTPSPPADDAELVQQRAALLGKSATGVASFAVVVHLALGLTVAGYAEPPDEILALLVLGVGFSTLLWWSCSGAPRSRAFVNGMEAVALLGASTGYSLTLLFFDVHHHFERLVLLGMTFMAVMRTTVVPSRVLRTLVMTALMGVPLLISVGIAYRSYVPQPHDPLSYTHRPLVMVAWTLVWWSTSVGICGFLSSVLYGLRRQVRAIRKLGKYTLAEKLGEGGMGSVYRAHHAMMRRPTAIKLLARGYSSERALARFEREVQLTSKLSHPNTITIYDYGRTPHGVFYYAMELLDGATLDDIVEASGPQPPARVVAVMKMVASALVEAHGFGLIHRDIKPGNVILCKQGGLLDVAKVLDFGLVKELEGQDDLSRASELTGTPLYLSPEAITRPSEVDHRSDIYALGAVGFFLLTGDHVFTGETIVEICSHHLHSAVPLASSRVAGVPRDLEGVIRDCLAKDPDARPESASELLERLEECDYVSDWTQADARAWWDTHQGEIDALKQAFSSMETELDIDLQRRG